MRLKICELLILHKGHPPLLLHPAVSQYNMGILNDCSNDIKQNICAQTLKLQKRNAQIFTLTPAVMWKVRLTKRSCFKTHIQ